MIDNAKLQSGGGRIAYLDALKCIGILLVIEGHVRGAFGIQVYDTLSGLMLYSFDMPIFFFVSGFLAYKGNIGPKDAIDKIRQKFAYLVVPAVILKLFSDLIAHRSFFDVFTNGFKGYWFTITLFEIFLIYYVVQLIFKKEIVRNIALLIIAFAGLGVLRVNGSVGPNILDLNHLTKYFQYFVFGVLAMNYKSKYERLMQNEAAKTIALLSFFVLLFIMGYDIKPAPVHNLLRDVVLRYLGTFIVISFFVCHAKGFDKETRINKIILSIGQKSLPIYLLQYFFIPHFNIVPNWIVSLDIFSIHIISCFYMVVITGTCLLFISILSNSKVVKRYVLGQK